MAELRHDFRRWYGCSYDEVGPEEAIDLIRTLPRGSLWRSAQMEFGELTDEEELAAQIQDRIYQLMQLIATRTTEGAPRVTRPHDMRERKRAAERAREARRRLEETEWEEVE